MSIREDTFELHNEAAGRLDWTNLYGYESSVTGSYAPFEPITGFLDWRSGSVLAGLAAVALASGLGLSVAIGTGGSAGNLLRQRHPDLTTLEPLGNLLNAVGDREASAKKRHGEKAAIYATADLVAEIKATLGLNVTDLAAIAKVSRQTLYDWIDGGTISPKNYERLFALRQICQAWREMATKPVGKLVHARTDDQTSLFDLLQQDALDQEAIRALLETLAGKVAEREAARQERAGKLQPLSDEAYRKNLLIHSRPATDS